MMGVRNVATDLAALRRRMTAEVLALLVTKEAGSVLSPEEIDYAWREVVRQGLATDNGDGTHTLTTAGRECIEATLVATKE